MKRYIIFAGLLAALCWVAPAAALDQIRTHTKDVIRGQITEISPEAVKIDKRPIEETVPVNEIISISFDREPDELSKGRNLAHTGQYEEAIEALKGVNRKEAERRLEMVQDLDFYNAYCATKLALGGAGSIAEAGKQMLGFLNNNKTSYHYLQAAELMGDLYVAFGTDALRKNNAAAAKTSFDRAMDNYAIAGKAPWPGADVGLNLKRGRALLVQKKNAEAIAAFQSVLDGAAGPQAESLKLEATLGKATALAMDNKADQGVELVKGVIDKTPKSDTDLHAKAYLALGNCHKAGNKPKEAIMDYLHVDLLYFQDPQVHAEALGQLALLWQSLSHPERAREASAKLAKLYPNSVWAK